MLKKIFMLVLVAPLALATLREEQASHIMEGRVLSLKKEFLDKNWHYTARVKVLKFMKAELFSEQEAEVITVKYWKTGPRGQKGQIYQGDQVRMYMVSAGEPDTYSLLMPNGWELLPKDHVYYMEREDDEDLYELNEHPFEDDDRDEYLI